MHAVGEKKQQQSKEQIRRQQPKREEIVEKMTVITGMIVEEDLELKIVITRGVKYMA
tara:strand:+ start:524 stop:694 length:171 start_codon:yes stop_codon:yes gene_type:complete